jgi:hypothetical protein
VNTTRPTRIAITSGAAVLCLGVAAPSVAYACSGDGTSGATQPASARVQQLSAPTLQQEQAWIDSFVSHRTAWLDQLSAVVSADSNLTVDQQAKALDSIAQAKAALTDLQSAVDAATSTDQVHDIVKAALEAMPMPWWPQPMTRHHAFDHHTFKADHRDRRDHKASPSDVNLRSADDNTRMVRYADHYSSFRNRDGLRDFGAQHWSHRGEWSGDHHGDHHFDGWGGRDGGGDHGGWGR